MTNAPQTRKTHVIRILGTNKAGDILQDIWADVERIDVAKEVTSDGNHQGTERKIKWFDDPDGNVYYPDDTHPTRTLELVKVFDPENTDDFSDPEEWIPIYRIKRKKSVNSNTNYQGRVDKNKNDEENVSRVAKKRRILHYDTNIDDEAEAAFDADPSRKVYVVSGKRYERDDSTKDEDQYVEHEVITHLKKKGSIKAHNETVDGAGKQVKLLNDYLVDESEPAKLEDVGPNGFDPPYRLDPYQNIININWGGIAVEFYDGAE